MVNKQIKDALVCDLKNGVLQPFQLETQLRLKGVSSFDIEGLKNEILEAYENDPNRY